MNIYPPIGGSGHACLYTPNMVTKTLLRQQEKRTATRYAVSWPVELANGRAKTRNFSASGVYLECDVAVRKNAVVNFSVHFSDHQGTEGLVACSGKAVRVVKGDDGSYGVAVRLQSYRFL